MSLYDYRLSLEISKHDPPFCALIMSAIRKADSTNLEYIRMMWPEVVQEFKRRYHAPGGILPENGPICTCDNPECEDCPDSCPMHGTKESGVCPDHGGKP